MPTAQILLGNLSYSNFIVQYWNRECLLVRGAAERYADLFSWSALDTIMSTQRFDFPRLRLVRKGKVIPPNEYFTTRTDRRGNPYVTHMSSAVAREMRDGAMLHVTMINDAWEPLSRFASGLEIDLTARVQINLHAAIARSKGFATHWDGHDVFVMQVAGTKAWRLYGSTEIAPLAVPPDKKHDPPTDMVREVVLQAGDMLYVPRGYWHAAEALEDTSLHLTCAAQYPNGLDFLGWLTKQLEAIPLARQDIPFAAFELADSPSTQRTKYAAELVGLLSREESSSSIDRFLKEYRSSLGQTNDFKLKGG
jgi:ribosomal protein L16 Arg81 hydroxylase